jgi:hypothetical protein
MVQFRFLFVYKNPQYREILRRMQPTRAFHVYSADLCFLLMAISISVALPPVDKQISRQVALFVEGDSSSIPKFINVCRQMGRNGVSISASSINSQKHMIIASF